ncbi:MAG: PaaX family transcriptional regulator [Pseudonocardiales bacterium]|nr:MAG: PaaX family transcriptional regulator [Pseudonocardiales bacterium]
MRARAALFDVYGDHLRSRGGAAPVAALVRLLTPLNITAPAVRTAVSRMVRQGWLAPVGLAEGPGYALTERAAHRLDGALTRIYGTRGAAPWDGRWHLLVATLPASRSARARLAGDLAFLGYGRLGSSTWLAVRDSPEVAAVVAAHGGTVEAFDAVHAGDPLAMIDRAWDLGRLAAAYTRFVDELAPVVGAVGPGATDETAFATRSLLVHAWRNFLFTDPGLPPSVLPEGWPGARAAAFFDTEAGRLSPAATRYVDCCLGGVALPASPY